MSVSRAPLRVVLTRLQHEGLVDIQPSVHVKERDPDKQGRAVLIQIERTEDLRGNALTE